MLIQNMKFKLNETHTASTPRTTVYRTGCRSPLPPATSRRPVFINRVAWTTARGFHRHVGTRQTCYIYVHRRPPRAEAAVCAEPETSLQQPCRVEQGTWSTHSPASDRPAAWHERVCVRLLTSETVEYIR